MEILVYITDSPDRIIGGGPLVLHMEQSEARQQCVTDFELALQAKVVQLNNGDHLIFRT